MVREEVLVSLNQQQELLWAGQRQCLLELEDSAEAHVLSFVPALPFSHTVLQRDQLLHLGRKNKGSSGRAGVLEMTCLEGQPMWEGYRTY